VPEGCAFAIVRDLTYSKLKKLPDLFRTHPDKAQDFLPDFVKFNADSGDLVRTYRGGQEVRTNLGDLNILEVSLAPEAVAPLRQKVDGP
jgi:hypothetical protein